MGLSGSLWGCIFFTMAWLGQLPTFQIGDWSVWLGHLALPNAEPSGLALLWVSIFPGSG